MELRDINVKDVVGGSVNGSINGIDIISIDKNGEGTSPTVYLEVPVKPSKWVSFLMSCIVDSQCRELFHSFCFQKGAGFSSIPMPKNDI